MQKFVVDGGVPLKGQVAISGAKNAAIKMVAASLLTSEEVILENIPRINDVDVIVEIVQNLGVKTQVLDEHTVSLTGDEVFSTEIPHSLGVKSRSAVVTIGPLLARFGKVRISEPGGCRIGLRSIDRHLKAFQQLGATVDYERGTYFLKAPRLKGAPVRFEKNTVMGTENILFAAALAEGQTDIFNAATEPEVNDLIELLVKMGASIKRDPEDPRHIIISGVKELTGARHRILPDRNEAVTFAIAAAITRGNITITGVRPIDLTPFLVKLSALGVGYMSEESNIRIWSAAEDVVKPITIQTAPHPGFVTDWQQPMVVLLSQAEGESFIYETVYEKRFDCLDELQKMGLKYELLTPSQAGLAFNERDLNFDWLEKDEPRQVIKINGPTPLIGARLMMPDLRAGATLVLAALAASGQSEIFGVEHLDRGYESFEKKLKGLGAKIERVDN